MVTLLPLLRGNRSRTPATLNNCSKAVVDRVGRSWKEQQARTDLGLSSREPVISISRYRPFPIVIRMHLLTPACKHSLLQAIAAFIPHAMAPTLVHLPNGQTLTVTPVFAGLAFKANDLSTHHSIFPPGWTIIIESEDELDPDPGSDGEAESYLPRKRSHIHRYKIPTLRNDNLFISSISNPSNIDFKPATSPTRQIAMMLWATLYWYFHQV